MQTRTIRLPPEVEASNAGELKQEVDRVLGQEPCILAFDLRGVNYMTSAGLGVLVYAFKRAQELGGSIRIHQPQPAIIDLFRNTHFDQVLDVRDTPAEAVQTE